MEAVAEIESEETIQFEDVQLSDSEVDQDDIESMTLRIDYNSRLVSNEMHANFFASDSCDTRFSKNKSYKSDFASNDQAGTTSDEEFTISDEDQQTSEAVCLKKIDLDGIACASSNCDLNSTSSFDYSTTCFKEECLTDAEYISDEESDLKLNEKMSNNASVYAKKNRKLSFGFGLSVAELASTVKDVFSSKQTTLSTMNITNPFFSNIDLKKGGLSKVSQNTKSSLMTCLEFLKSEPSEDELTDVEDFFTESLEDNIYNSCDLEEAIRFRGKHNSQSSDKKKARNCSWTMELISDDETFQSENKNEENNHIQKRNTKQNVEKADYNESLTDEEIFDFDRKEWTETDESGSIRQITQIKTETSIKLEGDGAVRSLRKVPKRESSDEEKKSTDSEQEDLSFTEKKSFFQRLSLTSDTLPTSNKWAQDVSLDDLPMAEGEIIQEQISFEDKLKMFEPDEGNRKKIQKREKSEQPTVYLYNFTKSDKPSSDDSVSSGLEMAEEIVKQVNDDITDEENIFTSNSHNEISLDSAITLEKVEQEVYSLIDKVDKEEKELYGSSHVENIDKCVDTKYSIEDALLDTEVVHKDLEFVMSETNDASSCKLKTEAEESSSSIQVHPPMESSGSESPDGLEQSKELSTEQIEDLVSYGDTERKFSIDQCKKEEYNEAIKLDVDDDNIEMVKQKSKSRPSNLEELSSVVDSHIKSEILREEIVQSIEESPLEVKHIVEDLELISDTDDHKCNVYKHIRTEIFTQELGQDIESGSPERKELGTFSLKKSDSPSDDFSGKDLDLDDNLKCEKSDDLENDYNREITGILEEGLDKSKVLSPQISEESCGHTDEISSEGIVVEHDEHLVEYEEALEEHSLTEQLKALASDSIISPKPFVISESHEALEFRSHDFDHIPSSMNANFPDLDMHRRSKDVGFSRHDKKEMRSLKSTKQVSTIEEHSSIESCDSPQELILQELPEKYDAKEKTENDLFKQDKSFNLSQGVSKDESLHLGSMSTNECRETNFSSPEKDEAVPDSLPFTPDVLSCSNLPLIQTDEFTDKSCKMSRSDSKSSHSRKSDSDAEGSKLDSSGEASGKRKEESCSSSGETESPYYSVETSDSGKTPRSTPAASRPCSSEFDVNVFSGHGSEYETCVTSQEASGEASGSYATAVSSQEISYATACSSFSHSSRESAYSVDSESSGHLASVEVSSEASETLVPSAQEMECEFAPDLEMPVLDEEPASSEESVREPYDMEIPESIIREGIEMPFMKGWDLKDSTDNEKMKQLPQQWMWQYASESEVADKFEVLESSDVIDESVQTSTPIASKQPESECANKAINETVMQYQSQSGTSSHSGPSHRRSYSSVIDIIPDRELIEQTNTAIDEEQLSVSESSATHSEQTWQTSSIDTAVQLSSHALVSSVSADGSNLQPDSFQETPPDKELIPEQSNSPPHDTPYLQLNGPVEVEFNPDYDNLEGAGSISASNQNHSPVLYESEGLQFDLEMEGSSNNAQIEPSNNVPASSDVSDVELGHENGNLLLDGHHGFQSSDYDSQNISSLDAEKPEAQQEQSFMFQDYSRHESESLVCPDLASYLPESDQCDLLPGAADSLPPSFESEINIPCAESLSSSESMPHSRVKSDLMPDCQSLESLEKGEIVDTSPEDERYESVKPTSTKKSPNEEFNYRDESPASKFSDNDVLNPESDYASQTFSSKYEEIPGTDLYTHREEDEFDLRGSDVYPSPIPSVEDDKQSTPSSDAFHGRRFFPRSGDTSAASSLQEFERLEAEIAAGRISRSSIDSNEKVVVTKSGDHDDVSMTSLTEFEKLEKECVETETDNKVGVDDLMLSEIEEGLESQCSDALEILHESMHDASDLEYEQRRLEMEELIKVTQSNVEKFQEETASEGITSDECTVLVRITSDMQDTSEATKSSSKEDANTDVEESENLAMNHDDITVGGHDSNSSGDKNCGSGKLDCMVSSTDSMDPSSSTATHAYQFETDSVMSSSLNSAQASGEECTMVSSTDTLEPEAKLTYCMGDNEEKMHLTQAGDVESQSKKGALACKLEELQATNGAKQQMEMFLSKLTDDTVLMDDFTSHSFPDFVEGSEHHTAPDDFIQSNEAAQGISSSGDDSVLDGEDLISRATTTTTTRIVTTVTTDDGEENDQQTDGGEDLRHSVEVILNQFMSEGDSSKQEDSHSGPEE